ncbi:Uncharacterised protein [Vibrio cholerae]|nr:Uncharacterised protein [Vibrio cholerae]
MPTSVMQPKSSTQTAKQAMLTAQRSLLNTKAWSVLLRVKRSWRNLKNWVYCKKSKITT